MILKESVISENENWIVKRNNHATYIQSKLFLEYNFEHAFLTKKVIKNNPKDLSKLIVKE